MIEEIASQHAASPPNTLSKLPAPAKINLFLHITGRRQDGYHLLQSVFCLLDLHDSLDITSTASPAIIREDVAEPRQRPIESLPSDDLCTRAARLLQQYSGSTKGAHIRLTKRIPTQAGLGGGSSDAATTLMALNFLWRLHYPLETLQVLGAQLGADVPFFIGGCNAWVEGVGEQLTPLLLPKLEVLLLKPSRGVSTAEVFKHLDLQRDCPHATHGAFHAEPLSFGRNVMQPIAERLCPEIGEGIAWLDNTRFSTHASRMSGSGSCVFAARLSGLRAALNMPNLNQIPNGAQVYLCKSLSTHPVHTQLGLKAYSTKN